MGSAEGGAAPKDGERGWESTAAAGADGEMFGNMDEGDASLLRGTCQLFVRMEEDRKQLKIMFDHEDEARLKTEAAEREHEAAKLKNEAA